MKKYLSIISTVIIAFFLWGCAASKQDKRQEDNAEIKKQKYNVLFVAVDDLNDWVGVLDGHPQVQTPNIDKFCKEGSVIFKNAVCAGPTCGPSRSALLSGFLPSTTGVYDNGTNMRWSKQVQENATLPEYFSKNGYKTLSRGKIFHKHFTSGGIDEGQWAFDEHVEKGNPTKVQNKQLYSELKNMINGEVIGEQAKKRAGGHISWGPTKEPFEETMDYRTADWAKQQLDKTYDQPFFMAVGFTRPHLPWFAPQEFFDKYDVEKIIPSKVLENDLEDIVNKNNKPMFKASDEYKWIKKNGLEKEVTRAYLANISYVDACLGVVFDALEKSQHAENTIVVLWGDHGYHIGEKMRFKKHTLWAEVTKVPFIVRMPDTKGQTYCSRPVSLIDIYPTLVELCDLPKKELDGRDFSPLLKNPQQNWAYPGVTVAKNGVSIMTEEWHYIKHNRNTTELYDIINDPMEWNNLANNPKHSSTIDELKKWIPKDRVSPLKSQGDRKNDRKKKYLNIELKATRNLTKLK